MSLPGSEPELRLSHLPFEVGAGVMAKASIGLVVLATDQTIETEYRHLLGLPGIGLFEARLHNDASITPESLARMEALIADAVRLILPGQRLDVIGFGCTSGAMVIGEEQVAARIREARPGIAVTNPVTAAFSAFRSLDARRVALVTPYVQRVTDGIRDFLVARGLEVPVVASFDEEDDNVVARIEPASILNAVVQAGAHASVDAVFISCTSLRFAAMIPEAEARLGKPITTSNHAMAWHSLRLAGVTEALPGRGRLFECGLAADA
jgi:maleate isomerase